MALIHTCFSIAAPDNMLYYRPRLSSWTNLTALSIFILFIQPSSFLRSTFDAGMKILCLVVSMRGGLKSLGTVYFFVQSL